MPSALLRMLAAQDALESWDPDKHPRGPGGRFISLGAAGRDVAKAARKTAAKPTASGLTHEQIVEHARSLSDEDLARLHSAISEVHTQRQAANAAERAAKPPTLSGHGRKVGTDAGGSPVRVGDVVHVQGGKHAGKTITVHGAFGHGRVLGESHTGEKGLVVETEHIGHAPAAPVRSAEDRIRAAYHDLAAGRGRSGDAHYVDIADLREHPELQGLSRAEVDRALGDMISQPDVSLIPEADQSALTQRHWDAAPVIGGEHKHLIGIEPKAAKPTAAQKMAAAKTAQAAQPISARLPNTVTPREAEARLSRMSSREEGNAYLAKASKADLLAILDAAGSTSHSRGDTKEKLRRSLVELTIGKRIDSDAIRRSVMEEGKRARR